MILPCYLGDSEPALQRVSGALPKFNIKLWLLTHPDLRHVARVRAFMNFIAARIAEQTALIQGRLPGATSRRTRLGGASPIALACDAVWVRLLRQVLPEGDTRRPSGNGFDQTPVALRLATNSRMRFAFMPTSLEPTRDILSRANKRKAG